MSFLGSLWELRKSGHAWGILLGLAELTSQYAQGTLTLEAYLTACGLCILGLSGRAKGVRAPGEVK